MAKNLKYNGTVPQAIKYNSTNIKKVTYNGVTVWTAEQVIPGVWAGYAYTGGPHERTYSSVRPTAIFYAKAGETMSFSGVVVIHVDSTKSNDMGGALCFKLINTDTGATIIDHWDYDIYGGWSSFVHVESNIAGSHSADRDFSYQFVSSGNYRIDVRAASDRGNTTAAATGYVECSIGNITIG